MNRSATRPLSHRSDVYQAIAAYTQAIQNDSHCVSAYLHRGNAYLEAGDHASAIADFSQVIRLNPSSADAYNGRAIAYLNMHSNEMATGDFGRALRLAPELAFKSDDRLVGSYAESPRGGFHAGHRKLHPRFRLLNKIRNTFLQAHWLWPLIVDDRWYDVSSGQELPERRWLNARVSRRIDRILSRLGFWPSLGRGFGDVTYWSELNFGDHYAKLQPSSYPLIDEIESRASSRDASILELGCNCGRHLHALVERGFTDLCGVDVSRSALNYMDIAFPGLRSRVQLSHMTFQQFLSRTQDNAYDIVFSHGATVEFVHPSFPLVKHLTRIAKDYVLLVITENGPNYPRFWTYEFERAGFVLVKLLRPCAEGSRTSLLVYRTIS